MLTPQTEPKKERTSDPPLTDLGATKTPSTNLTLTVIAKADRLKPVDLTFCMELKPEVQQSGLAGQPHEQIFLM